MDTWGIFSVQLFRRGALIRELFIDNLDDYLALVEQLKPTGETPNPTTPSMQGGV
jgi:hypothetical protein